MKINLNNLNSDNQKDNKVKSNDFKDMGASLQNKIS